MTIEPPLTWPRNDDQSIAQSQVRIPRRSDQPKRYRPPVAVKTVPLEIERGSNNGIVSAPVQAVPEFEPHAVTLVNSAEGKIPTLHMSLTQVRSLTLGGTLHSAHVADTSICKAVESGPRQLKLIGTGEGTTKLIVVAESDTADGKTLQREFEIQVSEAPQAKDDSIVETVRSLNHSIREKFPHCEVAVFDRGDELMVAGRCDSQESAKKIMRMVRKTCLVPVKDELIVH